MNAVACFHQDTEGTANSLSSIVESFAVLATEGIRNNSQLVDRRVNKTIESLGSKRRALEAISEIGFGLASHVRTSEMSMGQFFDPELELCDSLKRVKVTADSLAERLSKKERAIDQDRQLKPTQRSRLHAAYAELMAANARVAQSMDALCAAIEFHDENQVGATVRGMSSFEDVAFAVHGDEAALIGTVMDRLASSPRFSVEGALEAFLNKSLPQTSFD